MAKATTEAEGPSSGNRAGSSPAETSSLPPPPSPEEDPCAARVRAAFEDRDRLLSVAAHDIRTPLASLRLYLDALIKAAERGRLEPAEAATRLRKAQRQCDRLNVLINNMMDAARGQSQPISLVLETLDLVPVVMTACDRMRDQFTHQGRTLQVSAPSHAVTGDWDRPRLEQIVMNLLSNVYKHAPGASARVQIEADDGERVLLRVSDDGPGIPEEHKNTLFARQADGERRKHGVGLWIVAQIVQAFGGRIQLEESPPKLAGERTTPASPGASFAIDLPVRRRSAPLANAPSNS